MILRLCTNEKEVIRYWDSIDNQLELDIDVLDDQIGDGAQVIQKNGWLTYGAPIHRSYNVLIIPFLFCSIIIWHVFHLIRMREFGSVMKEFDIIDESLLSSEQMRIICATLCVNNTCIITIIILLLFTDIYSYPFFQGSWKERCPHYLILVQIGLPFFKE